MARVKNCLECLCHGGGTDWTWWPIPMTSLFDSRLGFGGTAANQLDEAAGGCSHSWGKWQPLVFFLCGNERSCRDSDGGQAHFKKYAGKVRIVAQADDFSPVDRAETGNEGQAAWRMLPGCSAKVLRPRPSIPHREQLWACWLL